MKKTFFLFPILILFLLSTVATAGEISFGLEKYMNDHPWESSIKVIVRLEAQADIEYLDNYLRQTNATRKYRHKVVVTELRDVAESTQGELLNYLAEKEAEGSVLEYRPFWIFNAIAVDAERDVIQEIASRQDVDLVYPDVQVQRIEPVEVHLEDSRKGNRSVEPGLEVINAPQVWAMGYTGEGALICDQDTGADGNHPAYASRWRGLEAPWEECWLDVLGTNTQFPYDSGNHGTHTLGTILGATAGDTVGVAPSAKWIASNSVGQGAGSAFDSDVIQTFEWCADPDGDPETIEDVPDVVNNSWGVNEFFSGYVDCDERYNESIINCEAAGCIVIFAAGNEGPSSNSLRSPSDQIMSFTQVFSVGAVNGNVNPPYPIASFSSKGPSNCDGPPELKIKPEVSAPGVDVRSSLPGGSYGTMSGTSMACPHVVGVIALMRGINPDLDVQRAKEILMESAVDQGDPGEDNTFGWGIIDAYEAALLTFQTMSAFEGYVTDAETGEPLGAEVYIPETPSRTMADEETGFYHLGTTPDTTDGYQVYAEYFGYYTYVSDIFYIGQQDTVELDIQMEALPSGLLVGQVTDTEGNPLPEAQLSVKDLPIEPVYTDGEGFYQYDLAGDYTYLIDVYAADHDSMTFDVYVAADTTTQFDVELAFVQSFESTDGDFTLAGDTDNEWEWGMPTPDGGPPAAYMGQNVWGTDLDDTYQKNANWELITPEYELTDSDSVILKFFTWYNMDDGWDGGNVRCRTDVDTTWTIVHPDVGYPDNSVVGLVGKPGFTGDSDGWLQYRFDLTEYVDPASESVQLMFYFGSTNSQEDGWFIDNFTMYGTILNPFLPPFGLEGDVVNGIVELEWQAPNAEDYTGFNLYRRMDDEEYGDPHVTLPAAQTTYSESADPATYYYVVSAMYDDNESAYSNEISVSVPVSADDGLLTNVPANYELAQNHPNPFNPATEIRYALPEKTQLSLKIYDISGKLIKTLKDDIQDAGYHSVIWNGNDEAGNAVSSGIYIYRLESDNYRQSKRMIMLK